MAHLPLQPVALGLPAHRPLGGRGLGPVLQAEPHRLLLGVGRRVARAVLALRLLPVFLSSFVVIASVLHASDRTQAVCPPARNHACTGEHTMARTDVTSRSFWTQLALALVAVSLAASAALGWLSYQGPPAQLLAEAM